MRKHTKGAPPVGHAAAPDRYEAERLVSAYADLALRVAYTYVGNRADAEDISQDVLIKLMYHAPHFESLDHERAWVIRCTANAAKDFIKSASVRKVIPFDGIEAAGGQFVAPERDDARFSAKDVLSQVMKLPLASREVIYLRYFERMSIVEIATITGISEAAVTKRLSRARQDLKIKLEKSVS
ncbi:MAG: RNA polymerase sigma factor [Atopobiaceae bacterium]|jgi:RNA polymerase sigma factor (sigma-70 family)